MINNKENPENHPIYYVDTDMGSSMLFNDSCPQKSEPGPSESTSNEPNQHFAEAKQEHEHRDLPSTPQKRKKDGGIWILME